MSARSRAVLVGAVVAALVSGCAPDAPSDVAPRAVDAATTTTTATPTTSGTVRLVFVGDVMLGRGVAPVVASDPGSVFERLRPALVGADLALANLESPLTARDHVHGEFALEADPAAARLLAGAGLDVVDLANNHASDAGPATIDDTRTALDSAGVVAVGAGADAADAAAPYVTEVRGVLIGILGVDLSGGRVAATAEPGVNGWDGARMQAAVSGLRSRVDVLVVGLHGGVEYLPRPDPALVHVTELLVEWGADVVWGHGAHVAYPVEAVDGTVVAPGLGNALFDQSLPGTDRGALLEVLADTGGVIAMRTGRVSIAAGRSAFDGWDQPIGDAVALDGEWWTPVRPWSTTDASVPSADDPSFPPNRTEVARAAGDVAGTGTTDLVIAYRRPVRPERVHDAFPEVPWVDASGRSAHLAVYAETGRLRWASALMPQPVGAVAACDGALALGITTLDDPSTIAGTAWFWDGFGFRTAPTLAGPGVPACADIDRDGRTDPILTHRSD